MARDCGVDGDWSGVCGPTWNCVVGVRERRRSVPPGAVPGAAWERRSGPPNGVASFCESPGSCFCGPAFGGLVGEELLTGVADVNGAEAPIFPDGAGVSLVSKARRPGGGAASRFLKSGMSPYRPGPS